MSSFVAIIFRLDGSYLVPVKITRAGSAFQDVEMVPRELLEALMEDGKSSGQVIEPLVSHGSH